MIDEEVNDGLDETGENMAEEAPEGEAVEEPAAEETPETADEEEPAAEETPEGADEEEPAAGETPETADEEEPADEETPEGADEEEPAAEEAPEAADEEEPAADAAATRILFLCTGNSCRSQMAEGLLRNLGPDNFESLSAGSSPAEEVHPLAIAAMGELDIDISAQRPKSIEIFLSGEQPPPNIVISVCARASEECPAFTGADVHSMSLPFDDPAEAEGSDEEKMEVFRRVRDEIRETLQQALGL